MGEVQASELAKMMGVADVDVEADAGGQRPKTTFKDPNAISDTEVFQLIMQAEGYCEAKETLDCLPGRMGVAIKKLYDERRNLKLRLAREGSEYDKLVKERDALRAQRAEYSQKIASLENALKIAHDEITELREKLKNGRTIGPTPRKPPKKKKEGEEKEGEE